MVPRKTYQTQLLQKGLRMTSQKGHRNKVKTKKQKNKQKGGGGRLGMTSRKAYSKNTRMEDDHSQQQMVWEHNILPYTNKSKSSQE